MPKSSGMTVYFDIEIKHGEKADTWPPEFTFLLEEIRSFFIQRMGVLKDQIEIEEMTNKAFIYIKIMDKPPSYSFGKFSEPLQEKMEQCISPDDLIYVQTKVAYALGLR